MDNKILAKLQANILKPHGREYSWYVFIKFYDVDPIALRSRISLYANMTTSALEQEVNTKVYKAYKTATEKTVKNRTKNDTEAIKVYKEKHEDEVIVNLCLSSSGYKKLDIKNKDIPKDTAFRNGMKGNISQNILNDTVEEWEPRYQSEIDALIIIAHNSEDRLKKSTEKIKFVLQGVAEIIRDIKMFEPEVEKGKKLKKVNGQDNPIIEHFGFSDGLSQPVLWSTSKKVIEKNLNLILVKDCTEMYGSYLVFRKLEQNVQAFNRKIKETAKELFGKIKPTAKEIEFVEAQTIGRFKDGTPLTLFDKPDKKGNNKSNKFNKYNPSLKPGLKQTNGYENDEDGLKCPFHAHIRKVNSRSLNPNIRYRDYQDGLYKEDEKDYNNKIEARIIRRGYPYDYCKKGLGRNAKLSDEPSKDVGLLFVSYQASIRNQFERISNWCNSRTFPNRNTTGGKEAGIDPLIGQLPKNTEDRGGNGKTMKQQWNVVYDGKQVENKKSKGFQGVVQPKGGEYFFTPSISFLESLIRY